VNSENGNKKNATLSLFNYGNYREFLRDHYAASKEQDKKFTFRYFSKIAGFKSGSFFQLVIKGERNLTEESIEKISNALKFNREERFFFRNLVLMNQATSTDERQSYADELIRSREYKKLHPLSEAQFSFYSQWYLAAIHEIVSLPHFKEDAQWIAASLKPPIAPKQAEKALEELLKLGLLKRDENGRLRRSEPIVTTPDEVVSAYLAHFHKEMLKKAGESIDRFTRDKREITGVTFSGSTKKVAQIKEIIRRCRKEILELTNDDPENHAVFQLNFQFFPLGETKGEGEDG
jgi:uncharacterized protein (TIGR02147 family)